MTTPYRVLVVDDSERWRILLGEVFDVDPRFELAGTASDGADAVAALEAHGADLVLLDISMPGMDGIAAIPALRAVEPRAAIVVFTATGNARVGEAQELGVEGCCHKGGSVVELLDQVEAAASRARLARPR